MVSGKNAVGVDQLLISNAKNTKKTNVSKSSKTQKNDEFSSMMDKQVQNDTAKPQESQKTEEDTKTPQQNEPTTTEKQEAAPENGVNVQALMQQFVVLPEQERAGLNWGNPVTEDVTVTTGTTEPVQVLTAKMETSEPVMVQTAVEEEKVSTQTDANISLKADVPKEAQPKISTETEDVAKQEPNQKVEKEKVETVQTTKSEVTHANKKTLSNEEVLDNKELVWQKESTKEDAVQQTVIPKAKTEENLLKFKVGETVNLSDKNATQDLADKILMRSLGKENNSFEIQLKPQELGSIKIKLVFEHGKVNVAMFCENQKAAEILSAHSTKLSEMIENRTGDQTNVLVQQKEENIFRDGGQKENHNQQNEQEQRRQRHDEQSDGEILDFVQQMRLGLLDLQKIT